MKVMEGFDKLYTCREIGDLCNVTEFTVREWIKAGKLRAALIGRSYLVAHRDLQAFIEDKYGVESPSDEERA